jgi:hypothetical protein
MVQTQSGIGLSQLSLQDREEAVVFGKLFFVRGHQALANETQLPLLGHAVAERVYLKVKMEKTNL